MKSIIKTIKNISFFTKLSFKVAPLQYFSAVLEIIWSASMPFVNLLFPKLIIDELTGGRQWAKVFLYISIWAVVNGAMVLLKAAQDVFLATHQERNEIKEKIYYGILDSNMDYGRLENGKILDEKNRVRDNLYISYFAHDPLANLIISLIKVAGYSYIVVTLHPIILILLVLLALANIFISSKKKKLKYSYQKAIAPFQRRFGYLFNALIDVSFAKEVRINNADSWLTQKFNEEKDNYIDKYTDNLKKSFIIDSADDAITFVQTMLLYVYCAFRVIKGTISIGSFSMYIGTFFMISGAISDLISQVLNVKYMSEYIDSYKSYEIAAIPNHSLKGRTDINETNQKHEIEFCNVSFKYPGSDKFALKNVSLKIESGKSLSVVGYNGAGKSTLIKLICRLYEPTEGVILYNGVDISSLKYKQYARLVAVVFQDFNIYRLSIRENLDLVRGNITDKEIWEALNQSGIDEKIRSLPKGIETQMGKNFDIEGVELSGGENQKLACARAYLKDSPLVILDEPTASLDPISESQLYQRFGNILNGKTAVYISHRLASSKFCDSIIVLDKGQIIESGTHDDLIKKNGTYADMYAKQAEHYGGND